MTRTTDTATHERTTAARAWARSALGRSRTTSAEHRLLAVFGFDPTADEDLTRLAIAWYRDGCPCSFDTDDPTRCRNHEDLAAIIGLRRQVERLEDEADTLLVQLHDRTVGEDGPSDDGEEA